MEEKIVDIGFKSEKTMLIKILDEFCEDMECIPTDVGKRYFRSWNYKVDPKLIRQCIYAGIFWALKHPELITVKKLQEVK